MTGNQQDTLYRRLRGRVFGQAFKAGAGLYCESAENRKRGMGGSLKLPEGTCLPADAPDQGDIRKDRPEAGVPSDHIFCRGRSGCTDSF